MFPQKHSVSPTLFAAPVSSSPSPSPSASSASPSAAQATLIKTSPVEPTLQYYALQDQYPAYPPQPNEDPNQHQQIQQQRLLLQQQQQQAQLQLHNLQIRQKKKLLEDQQQRLQQLQHQHQHQQQQQQQYQSHQPLFATSSSGSEAYPSSQPGAIYSPLTSLQQPPSASSQHLATHSQQQQQQFLASSNPGSNINSTIDTTSPSSSLISASGPAMTASMDILVPFPMHQRNSFDSSPLMLQQAIQPMKALAIQEQQQQHQQHQQHQQQQQQQQLQQQQELENSMFFHPLKYEPTQSRSISTGMDSTGPNGTALSGLNGGHHDFNSYSTNGWANTDNGMVSRNMAMLGPGSPDLLRRLSYSSGASDMSVQLNGFAQEMAGYNLNARIIRKKDQLDELSPSGAIVAAPVVEEVRTGQQFLIKLQLTKQGGVPPPAFPTMRVERREAINTAGEPRAEAEPLTLQIIVHLAKSGQIRKGACAKCCHKYGPSSPILVLLDPLSPSITDPSTYAHVDTSSGSVTILAKVMCSSTDHGERGNKDQYVFEFRLKRTSSMPNAISRMNVSPMGADSSDDDGETIAVCSTAPIMCSGHHKAKRVYPSQRPSKVTKDGPVPKTKTIKHKTMPNAAAESHQAFSLGNSDIKEDHFRSGSVSGSSSYPSPMSFMHDNITNSSLFSNFGDDQLSDFDLGSNINTSDYNNNTGSMTQHQQQQPLLNSSESPSGPGHSSTPAPRVFEVRPDRGPIRKTTDVVLRGLYFCDGMVPYFGCFPAQDIVVETSNLIICKAPESPLPGTVPITIYDSIGASFADLGQFTYTDDSETELLILQIQLRLAHRALEYLHTQATGQKGNANEILREIPGLAQSPRAGGGSPGGNVMAADPLDVEEESEPTMLTLEQVEEGLLKTLDNLPVGMDISIQLEDQSNLLHLSILLGFDRLTMRLIEEGCELDTLDAYAMTPLMYAVIKGNEQVVRALVIAGAASSGAKTPREFYAMLPRPIVPTQAMVSYLSVSCTRYSTTSRVLVASTERRGPVMIEIENDEGSVSSDSGLDDKDEDIENADEVSSIAPANAQTVPAITRTSPSEDATSLDQLAHTIRGMHVNANMAPLAQQGLPPMHVVDADGSVTVNTMVLKAEEIRQGDVPGAETIVTTNDESGYHSGIISEVQDRLSLMSHSALPSEGVTMSVQFNRAASSIKPSSPTTPTPDNLFRTGDSFGIEIRLATLPESSITLPKEFLGVRFPHEMVKRVNGRPASILREMAYDLRVSIELGRSNMDLEDPTEVTCSRSSGLDHDHHGDGIELRSACRACAKYLHEHRKISPSRISHEDPSAYPILQFSVPTASTAFAPQGSASPLEIDQGTGIMEVRNGHVEVKARVNCSSLHHLIQREKARRTAALRLQQQQQGESSQSSSSATASPGTPLDMKDLEDPGFVFTFELIHPTLHSVVSRSQTGPILFQSYSRGRS
ncbi:hypothetical protein BGZ68_004106 [Mortierella alpina]|nr:hypothetical protein BGZ68_004106 [Mortierella alpina]